MKRTVLFISVLTLSLMCLLCACTTPPEADIYSFVIKANKLTKTPLIEESSYFFDGEDEYSYFINTGLNRCILTLRVNDRNSVTSLRLSTAAGDTPSVNQQELFDAFVLLCSALSGKQIPSVTAELNENGILPSALSYTEGSVSFSREREEYFIFTNERIISMYCSLTN